MKNVFKSDCLYCKLVDLENASCCRASSVRTTMHRLFCVTCCNYKTNLTDASPKPNNSLPSDSVSKSKEKFKSNIQKGPSLQDFMSKSVFSTDDLTSETSSHPYIPKNELSGNGRKGTSGYLRQTLCLTFT